ncbi:unnamed protein product [Lactuca virosa]|uniref:Bifunctional inhibitor/plant lipid transfer protein/seed storage helical domain-containing protein n=1 Tax=Lactuca virosa TaxID=75947 RepID=A0AAU9PTY8_9ASTR|nr:unnamed protein product [Lactuca virosa]
MKIYTSLVVVLILMMILGMTRAAPSAAHCKKERKLAINACISVMYGRRPSSTCCKRARVSHVECICPVITPGLLATINVNRLVKFIEGCGRRVPRPFTCGSLTIP